MDQNTDTWKSFWQDREQRWLGKLLTWGRRNLVNEKLKEYLLLNTEKGVLIEAGCGTGEITLLLAAQRGDDVILVDRSPEALGIANSLQKEYRVKGQVILCDISNLSDHIKWSSDNIVFNIGVIEHFKDPCPILKEMAKVSGRCAIAIIPERSLFWLLFYKVSCLLKLVPSGFFVQFFTPEQLEHFVANAGLQLLWLRRTRVLGVIPYLGACFVEKTDQHRDSGLLEKVHFRGSETQPNSD